MSEYGCKIQYCIGDAGYCSPGIMERLVLSGIDFMTRLNPAYKLFKDTYEKNREQLLNDSGECLTVRYGNRLVRIIKEKQTVGYDKENYKPNDCHRLFSLSLNLLEKFFEVMRGDKTKEVRVFISLDSVIE